MNRFDKKSVSMGFQLCTNNDEKGTFYVIKLYKNNWYEQGDEK